MPFFPEDQNLRPLCVLRHCGGPALPSPQRNHERFSNFRTALCTCVHSFYQLVVFLVIIKYPATNDFKKEGRVYHGSHLEGTPSIRAGTSEQRGHVAAGHITSIVRKQRVVKTCAQATPPPFFLTVWKLSTQNGSPQLKQAFPLQLTYLTWHCEATPGPGGVW